MGFGVLFFGYLLNLSIFKQFTDVICFLIILYALIMLSRFNSGFRRAMYWCIPLIIAAGVYFVYELCVMLGVIGYVSIPERTATVATSYYAVFSGLLKIVFTSYLLLGIQEIGKETGVPVIELKAARNRFLTFVYYIPYIFTELEYPWGSVMEKVALYAFVPVFIFGIVYHIMNLALIHNCYVWICLEGEDNMERKRSRFSFVNRLAEKEDKLQERLVERKREQRDGKKKKK